MRIGSVGAELFHAGGQMQKETDMTKLILAFGNFANTLKNQVTKFRPHP
jgi:hypothetical protein